MSAEQYKTGLVSVTNASQIVIGTASCDWRNQIEAGHVFKIDEDNEATYTLATVLSATRLQLASNYGGSTGTGMSYMVCRSFTTNRGYWRPLQGDYDWAEIMSQETIDKIDTDIQNLSASLNINASQMSEYLGGLEAANASLGALQTNMVNANASLGALQTNMVNANASLGAVKGVWVSVNAANHAASRNTRLAVNSLTNIPTIKLTASPQENDFVEIRDVTGHFNGSRPTVLGNGNNINGQNASIVLNIDWITAKFTYVNAAIGYHLE